MISGQFYSFYGLWQDIVKGRPHGSGNGLADGSIKEGDDRFRQGGRTEMS
jgi:hypothetical protein